MKAVQNYPAGVSIIKAQAFLRKTPFSKVHKVTVTVKPRKEAK